MPIRYISAFLYKIDIINEVALNKTERELVLCVKSVHAVHAVYAVYAVYAQALR